MDFAAELTIPDYGELADELESIARTVRQNPDINHRLADRLSSLATQLRADINLTVREKKSA